MRQVKPELLQNMKYKFMKGAQGENNTLATLEFIQIFYWEHNKDEPTMVEIAHWAELRSESSVNWYLQKLENEGHIIRHGAPKKFTLITI